MLGFCHRDRRVALGNGRLIPFIDSQNLIDPLLEGACFTWSNYKELKEAFVLSFIDKFVFFIYWEDQRVHQVILPKTTLVYFSIPLS